MVGSTVDIGYGRVSNTLTVYSIVMLALLSPPPHSDQCDDRAVY